MTNTVARVAGGSTPNGAFLPEQWSTKLNYYYMKQTFLNDIANNDWGSGLLHQGGVINIRQVPEVQVFNYTIGEPMPTQNVDDEKIQLLINKAVGFKIFRDDIDRVQMDIDLLNAVTTNGAYQTKIKIETDVLGSIYGSASTSFSTTALDSTNAMRWVLTAGAQMDKLNVPDDGKRFIVIPPYVALQLQMSDLKAANMMGDSESVARKSLGNGHLGMIGGINVYVSNCLTKTADGVYHCIAGHRSATVYASQFTTVERGKDPDYFGDYLRGLSVYGFKVNKPEGLIHMPATVTEGVI